MSWKRRTIQMAPLKRCVVSLQRVGDCVGLRPEAAATPPSLLLLKIPLWLFWRARPWQSVRLQTPAPPFERHPWTSVAKHCFPLGVEIRDADEGKHWCFKILFCLPVKQCLQHNALSRVQCAAITNAGIQHTLAQIMPALFYCIIIIICFKMAK